MKRCVFLSLLIVTVPIFIAAGFWILWDYDVEPTYHCECSYDHCPSPDINYTLTPEEQLCLFYGRMNQIPFKSQQFPYPRETFNSGLIDLTFVQNLRADLFLREGWNRTTSILGVCKSQGIVLFSSRDFLFLETTDYLASWFRAYGCPSVQVFRDFNQTLLGNGAWVCLAIYVPDIPFNNTILIQTEQMSSPRWAKKLKPILSKCKDSPSCVVFDFSEANVVDTKKTVSDVPTVILPITLRNNPDYEIIPDITTRSSGYIFLGVENYRRKKVLKELNKKMIRWKDNPDVGYLNVKLCISIHFYASHSGLEFHRLAQHVKSGCLPLYETPGDSVVYEFFRHERALHFEEYSKFPTKAFYIMKCIQDYPEVMRQQQRFVTAWWGRELEAYEKVLKALWFNYRILKEPSTEPI